MPAVVLFDGVCNLCNASVLFIIDRDPRGYFTFVPLQSEHAQQLLHKSGVSANTADVCQLRDASGGTALKSVVLIEGGRIDCRSTAALRIARRLSGAWPLLYPLILIPRPLRDAVYNLIARNRYRWFGREETCRIPTPELRNRFLHSK